MNKLKSYPQIDPNRIYSIKDICGEGLIPWRKSHPGTKVMVEKDRENKNLLKTITIGERHNKRYHIKGENLIIFLEAVENGSYKI